jgi:hypothetical protein
VIETPGIGRSWEGDCIDDLTKPFTIFYTDPAMSGSYFLSPSSSTTGSIIEQFHTEGGGTKSDYKGSGDYKITPTDKDPKGRVIGMEIIFTTTGELTSCAGSKCFTNKIPGTGIQIPLRVQVGTCPEPTPKP